MQFRGPDRFFVVVINLIIKEPVSPFCLCSKMNNLGIPIRFFASGRVAPSGAALDADDVAGETDQDRREGGTPFAAGDLPDGGGGNPKRIVSNYSRKD
jgi:hypothetical protein